MTRLRALVLLAALAAFPAAAQQSGGENPTDGAGACPQPLQVPALRQDGPRWLATVVNPNRVPVSVGLMPTPAPPGFTWRVFSDLRIGMGGSGEVQIGTAILPTTEAEIRRTFTLTCMALGAGGWRRPGG